MKRISLFSGVIATFIAISANADPLALDIRNEGAFGLDGRDFTLGWAFSVSEALTVSALGAWDQDSDGLNESQTVSLWTSAGTFLSSVVVDNTATAVASAELMSTGQWLLADVADFVLGIGDYVIGANRVGGSGDAFQFEDTVIETDSRITWTGDRFSDFNTFGFPMNTTAGSPDAGTHYFGPTFSITDSGGPTPTPIPEPGTLAVFGLGLAGIGLMRRRRKV